MRLFKKSPDTDDKTYIRFLNKGLSALLSLTENMATARETQEVMTILLNAPLTVRPLRSEGEELRPVNPLRKVHKALMRTFEALEAFGKAEAAFMHRMGTSGLEGIGGVAGSKMSANEASYDFDKKVGALERTLRDAIKSGKLTNKRVITTSTKLFGW